MTPARALLGLALVAALPLAACHRRAEEKSAASGRVLEGTVSDAMIETDRVRSEAPYAAPQAAPSPGERDKAGSRGKPAKAGKPPRAAGAGATAAAPSPSPSRPAGDRAASPAPTPG